MGIPTVSPHLTLSPDRCLSRRRRPEGDINTCPLSRGTLFWGAEGSEVDSVRRKGNTKVKGVLREDFSRIRTGRGRETRYKDTRDVGLLIKTRLP